MSSVSPDRSCPHAKSDCLREVWEPLFRLVGLVREMELAA